MVNDWGETTLADVSSDISYGYTESATEKKVGPHFLRITDIQNGTVNWANVPYCPISSENHKKYLLQDGDIVIARTGNSTGENFLYQGSEDAIFASYLIRFRIDRQIANPKYIWYCLRSSDWWNFIRNSKTGSAQAGANARVLSGFPICLPPLPEQRAIAHVLGTLDDKIELNRKTNETLEAMAHALFKSWFVDFEPVRAKAEGRLTGLPEEIDKLFPDSFEESELGEVPKGWKIVVLEQLIKDVVSGDWGDSEQTKGETTPIRCIRGADIPDLQIGGTGKMPIRFLKFSSIEKRSLNAGDIVIEISGGSPTQSTGRPVLVSGELLKRLDMPLVCSNFCRMFRLKSQDLPNFIYLWLRSLYVNDVFLQFENGTTGIKNFAFTLFSSSYNVCIPPLDILKIFNQKVVLLFQKEQANATETEVLASLRDALLPKLLSGEVRIPDVEGFLMGRNDL